MIDTVYPRTDSGDLRKVVTISSKMQTLKPPQIRQLLGERDGGRQAHQPGPMGYGRSGGLRQAATALLPTDRCLPHMLLTRQPSLV